MATHNELGKFGEQLAQQYLVEHGYQIVETNWRLNKLEADIIALHEGMIVLVEVKTRRSDQFGKPEDFIYDKKLKSCVRLLNAYIRQKGRKEEGRIDVVSVVINPRGAEVELIPNAIMPHMLNWR